MPTGDANSRNEVVGKFTAHFHEVFEGSTRTSGPLHGASPSDEDPKAFVHAKLKVRCFEIFQSFDRPEPEQLIDRSTSPPLRGRRRSPRGDAVPAASSRSLLERTSSWSRRLEIAAAGRARIAAPSRSRASRRRTTRSSSRPSGTTRATPSASRAGRAPTSPSCDRVLALSRTQRQAATGAPPGKKNARRARRHGAVPRRPRLRPAAEARTRSTSSPSSAISTAATRASRRRCMQAEFFAKVEAYRNDQEQPRPELVFLGDYIDRGLFSLNGVLRTVIQLFVTAPRARVPAARQPRVLRRVQRPHLRRREARRGDQHAEAARAHRVFRST